MRPPTENTGVRWIFQPLPTRPPTMWAGLLIRERSVARAAVGSVCVSVLGFLIRTACGLSPPPTFASVSYARRSRLRALCVSPARARRRDARCARWLAAQSD
eukprot:4467067-Prymnesium_polylepis.2